MVTKPVSFKLDNRLHTYFVNDKCKYLLTCAYFNPNKQLCNPHTPNYGYTQYTSQIPGIISTYI